MKILSIDFDFFQNVTTEDISSYPDGVDNTTAISEMVWASHYAMHGEHLNSIDIMHGEFDMLKDILKKQKTSIPVMVTNSHKHIYDFIYDHSNGTPVELVNVDMHHDIINSNSKLDCGNWISHLINNEKKNGKRIKFTWLANPISFETYGIEDLFGFGGKMEHATKCSFSEIETDGFDIVFLCRSDPWTPPHLDKYFTELCEIIKGHFHEIWMERGIDKPRILYKEQAEQIAETYKSYLKDLNND